MVVQIQALTVLRHLLCLYGFFMHSESGVDALDSLDNHLGSRMTFNEVVIGDFEGPPDILGANGDSDTLCAD